MFEIWKIKLRVPKKRDFLAILAILAVLAFLVMITAFIRICKINWLQSWNIG